MMESHGTNTLPNCGYSNNFDLRNCNPLKVLFWEYTFLARDLFYAPSWKDRLVVLFGRPGETFEAPPKGATRGDVAPAMAAPVELPADAIPA